MSDGHSNPEATQGIVSDIPLVDVEREKKLQEYLSRINTHVNDEPDKAKTRKTCGSCLAFHTPFCTWEYVNYGVEKMSALRVSASDTACSRYYPLNARKQRYDRLKAFEEKVENL